MHEHARIALLASLVLGLIFFIYSGSLHGPFIFDDHLVIKKNPNIRLHEITINGLKLAAIEQPLKGRPLTYISFALNYRLHEYRVFGYHFVNVAIHIVAGIFLYLFVKTALGSPALHDRYVRHREIAFFAALIWLVHPVAVQSVAYIWQRANSMAAMFYIMSLFLYARARLSETANTRWVLAAGSAISGLLALGTKEIAATLPAVIFLYEWFFHQNLSTNWLKRHSGILLVVIIALIGISLAFLGTNPVDAILHGYGWRGFTLTERVMTEWRVVWLYLSLLIFPHPSRLNLDRDFELSVSLWDPPSTVIALLGLIGLLVLAIVIARKHRLISFTILWFLGTLVIESSVIPVEIIFEHRTYLPFMLPCVLVVIAIYRFIKPQYLRLGILVGLVAVGSFWTYQRAQVWGDEIALWRDTVEKSPGKVRPRFALSEALVRQGKFEKSIPPLKEALRIYPHVAQTHYRLGVSLALVDKTDEALEHLSQAVKLNPKMMSARRNLGAVLFSKGRVYEAITHLSAAARLSPENASIRRDLGIAMAGSGCLFLPAPPSAAKYFCFFPD